MADYDHHKMMQVLTNLLSNSLKFVEERVGEIKLSLSSNKKQIFYQVIDNGKGISEEDLPHIFKKFYQSKNQNLKKQKGSGFGLAICKQIVELHSGSISAQANRTKGACIQVEFPKNTAS
jgi:signal transduction histidine kinase